MKAPGSPSSALQMTYFFSPVALAGEAPLQPGGEAGAAAAAQAGGDHLLDHLLGRHGCQHLLQGRVALVAMYSSRDSGLIRPQLRSTIRFCLAKKASSLPGRLSLLTSQSPIDLPADDVLVQDARQLSGVMSP